MKRMIIAAALLLLPIFAHAQFSPVPGDIDRFFDSLSGTVVSIDGPSVYTDIGKADGAVSGLTLSVYRQGEAITHPVTGEVLGRKRTEIGVLRITDAFDNLSVGTISGGVAAVGDIVMLPTPRQATVSFTNIDEETTASIAEAVDRAENIVIVNDAPLSVAFAEADGGVRMEMRMNEAVIFGKFYPTVAGPSASTGEISMGSVMKSDRFSETYRSFTMGRLKPGAVTYIAASTLEKITIFGWDGKKVIEHETLPLKYDQILNLESMDMNGNGVDELIIVTVDERHEVNTRIYEYDGKKFTLLQERIPVIVRSTYTMGDKKLIAQRISRDGAYTGRIHYFGFENGEYRRLRSIEHTEGLPIFGFAPVNIDEDDDVETVSIDLFSKLTVRDGEDIIAEAADRFGETPYYFTITGLLKGDQKPLKPGEDYDETADTVENYESSFTERRYLRPRVMQDNQGRIYTLENEPKARAFYRSTGYEKAVLAAWRMEGGLFRSVWKPDALPAVIADMTFTLRDGKTWIAALRTAPGGFMSSDKSEFIFIEVAGE